MFDLWYAKTQLGSAAYRHPDKSAKDIFITVMRIIEENSEKEK